MEFRDYQKIEAVNASSLKVLALKSPLHYLYAMTHPQPETDAMRFGTAVHAAVLEPDKFATAYTVRPDDMDYRTKAGKDWREEQIANGRLILTADDNDRIIQMRDSIMSHPRCRSIIEGATVETTIRWQDEETGVLCKGRIDIVNGGILADLKTTKDIRSRKFVYSTLDFGYALSMAFYHDGLIANGIDIDEVFLIAIETAAPFDCAPYQLDDEWLELGRAQYRDALVLLKRCQERNEWPGMCPESAYLPFPKWAVPDDDGDFESSVEVVDE